MATAPAPWYGRTMLRLTRQLHIYAGLVSFAALALFGVVGLYASFEQDIGGEVETLKTGFALPPDSAGREEMWAVADEVVARFGFTHTTPVRDWMIHHPEPGHYVVDFYSQSGEGKAEIDLDAGTAKVRKTTYSTGRYLVEMHAVLPVHRPAPLVLLWSSYMQLTTVALTFLAVSGIYLWLATRPRHRWGRIAFAVGSLATMTGVVLFMV